MSEPVRDSVRYEVAERVATLTIDRPSVKNALGPEEWAQLDALARRAGGDPDVRALVITGAGGVFSAGGDLRTMPERLALPRHVRRARLLHDAQVIRTLRELPKPIVAAIEGVAVGAGLSLALACDVRLCASDAKLGASFHKIGLTGDFGILWTLPRAVGPTRAAELLYSADLIDGARAEAIGLVTRAVPADRVAAEARAFALKLAAGPPVALARTKRGLARALETDLAEMLAWEADAQAACSRTDDAREGVAAFLAKRAPQFQGK